MRTDTIQENSLFQPKQILVIEDDPCIAEVIGYFFEMVGYSFIFSTSTVNILQFIIAYGPDLILLDCLLPLNNGGKLCSQIKKNPHTRHIPIIIYSAYPKSSCTTKKYSCDAFISKPFDLDLLSGTIDRLIRKSRIPVNTESNEN